MFKAKTLNSFISLLFESCEYMKVLFQVNRLCSTQIKAEEKINNEPGLDIHSASPQRAA